KVDRPGQVTRVRLRPTSSPVRYSVGALLPFRVRLPVSPLRPALCGPVFLRAITAKGTQRSKVQHHRRKTDMNSQQIQSKAPAQTSSRAEVEKQKTTDKGEGTMKKIMAWVD